MSTPPGGDEPREDQPTAEEPTPAAPEPPAVPEPPAAAPEPPASSYPPPGAYPPPASSYPPPGYQQPAYQQPPASSYPPPGYQQPPAGGYGYQQAPPPGYQPPTGYAPGAGQPSLFGVAFSDGWKAFQRVGWTFVGAAVVWLVAGGIVLSIIGAIFGGPSKLLGTDGGTRSLPGAGFSLAGLVLGIVGGIIVAIIQAQFVRVALAVTRGHRPTFAEFFRFENAGPVATLALILGVVAGVLGVIPVVGSLANIVVTFLMLFAYYVLIDRKVTPMEAIRGSYELVTRNLGQTVVFYILGGLIVIASFFVCLVGEFVAIPWFLLATTYLYRRLTGEQPQLPA